VCLRSGRAGSPADFPFDNFSGEGYLPPTQYFSGGG
jgi:hypothetical protein